MSRMKSALAVLLLAAIAGLAPKAQGQTTLKLMVAGSSALWQSMALATYNGGHCPTGAVAPCFHYTFDKNYTTTTGAANFNLNDSRPKTYGGATSVTTDTGAIWIVWDSATTTAGPKPNVWAYIRVDAAVGARCYFAHPRCYITPPAPFPPADAAVPAALWGDSSADTTPVAGDPVYALFEAASGVTVNAAATDIRPEDALWATCRTNSALGLPQGLGYNSAIPAGNCPTAALAKSNLAGTDILAKLSTGKAHPVAFNISGFDPYSNIAIPAFTAIEVGAEPIVFLASLGGGGSLSNVTNVTDSQVQQAFSGQNCDAQALGASASDPLNVYLREPLSGTMNTIEYTAFAYPDFSGTSQETGVNPSADNPLNQPCAGSSGTRQRGIGTGDIINQLYKDGTANLVDSIGYAFFSYGNMENGFGSPSPKPIVDSPTFRYFTLNGVDPIFHKYVATASGTALDPGQPNASVGEIPGIASLPSTCNGGAGSFPCGEDKIWKGGLSFPNLRSGQYRAWSILRLVSDGAGLASAKALIATAEIFNASTVPDFVPVVAVAAKPLAVPPVPPDPGLTLLRSHYQQKDNNGINLGKAPVNDATTGDAGGDVGGCILHAIPGTSATAVAESDSTTKLVQNAPGSECAIFSTH